MSIVRYLYCCIFHLSTTASATTSTSSATTTVATLIFASETTFDLANASAAILLLFALLHAATSSEQTSFVAHALFAHSTLEADLAFALLHASLMSAYFGDFLHFLSFLRLLLDDAAFLLLQTATETACNTAKTFLGCTMLFACPAEALNATAVDHLIAMSATLHSYALSYEGRLGCTTLFAVLHFLTVLVTTSHGSFILVVVIILE